MARPRPTKSRRPARDPRRPRPNRIARIQMLPASSACAGARVASRRGWLGPRRVVSGLPSNAQHPGKPSNARGSAAKAAAPLGSWPARRGRLLPRKRSSQPDPRLDQTGVGGHRGVEPARRRSAWASSRPSTTRPVPPPHGPPRASARPRARTPRRAPRRDVRQHRVTAPGRKLRPGGNGPPPFRLAALTATRNVESASASRPRSTRASPICTGVRTVSCCASAQATIPAVKAKRPIVRGRFTASPRWRSG